MIHTGCGEYAKKYLRNYFCLCFDAKKKKKTTKQVRTTVVNRRNPQQSVCIENI